MYPEHVQMLNRPIEEASVELRKEVELVRDDIYLSKDGKVLHPLTIISKIADDFGWKMAVDSGTKTLKGFSVGESRWLVDLLGTISADKMKAVREDGKKINVPTGKDFLILVESARNVAEILRTVMTDHPDLFTDRQMNDIYEELKLLEKIQ